ncbi:MAG: hypothetical protein IT435_08170 [Phycisphaerales bacterium]|nr:hypothetical protein [Phycisphaerales bacterium]
MTDADQREVEELKSYLSARDVVCPSCAYNLRGLTADVCPECRQSLRLGVSLAEPRLGWWLCGVVGAGFGCGLNSLLLYYIAIQWVARGWSLGRTFMDWFIIMNVGGAAVMGVVLAAMLKFGRRLRRLSTGKRIAIAGVCWLLTLADATVFSLTIK